MPRSRLANTRPVAERIEELRSEISEQNEVNAAYIQRRLMHLIDADPRQLFETVVDGAGLKTERLKPISQLPLSLAAAVSKIRLDSKTGEVIGVDLHDKTQVGSVLIRSVGGFTDRIEHEIDDKTTGENRCLAELAAYILGKTCDLLRRYSVLLPPGAVVHQERFLDTVEVGINEIIGQLTADPVGADDKVDQLLDELGRRQRENRRLVHVSNSPGKKISSPAP
jgi:hypothetical protein